MKKNDAVELFVDFCDIPVKKTRIAFGMSKMTVTAENDVGDTEYGQLKYPEFIEMIGRVANIKYEETT